jgi:hypothetical protein
MIKYQHGVGVLRVSIDRDVSAVPAQCRFTLGGPAPKVIEGKVDGSWPT